MAVHSSAHDGDSYDHRDQRSGRALARLARVGAAVAIAGLASGGLPRVAHAAVPWSQEPIAYTVVDQDLRELLTEIGTRLGFRVRVSEGIKQHVHGRFPPAPPQQFIEHLASVYGFEWFYDGGTLWITTPAESQTKMLQLGAVTMDQLQATLSDLGAVDTRFPLRGSEQAGVVVVNGPPRFVELVAQSVDALQLKARPPAASAVVVHNNVP